MSTARVDVSKLLDHSGEELSVSGEVRLEPTKLGDLRIEFEHPIEFSLTLTNAGEGIIIRGQAHGPVQLRCSRCLDAFSHDASVDVNELALLTDEEPDKEVFRVEDSHIDLAPIIFQNIMVELPMRSLCFDDCSGLCATCGKNLNIEPHIHEESHLDERLAPLKDFFKKTGEKSDEK